MTTPDNTERNPFIEVAKQACVSMFPIAFFLVPAIVLHAQHLEGLQFANIDRAIMGLYILALVAGVPLGLMAGVAVSE